MISGPDGDRRGRTTRPLRFRTKRKFLGTHIRHRRGPGEGESPPPCPNVITVIEPSFFAAPVARIGRASGARSTYVTTARARHLARESLGGTRRRCAGTTRNPAEIEALRLPSAAGGRNWTIDPSQPYRPCSSDFHPPDRGPRAATLVLILSPARCPLRRDHPRREFCRRARPGGRISSDPGGQLQKVIDRDAGPVGEAPTLPVVVSPMRTRETLFRDDAPRPPVEMILAERAAKSRLWMSFRRRRAYWVGGSEHPGYRATPRPVPTSAHGGRRTRAT